MTRVNLPDGNVVHLWSYDIRGMREQADKFATELSEDEHARSQAFVDAVVRCRFVLRRGLLRRVLAAYLDRAPDRLAFAYGEHGKPRLCDAGDLSFNASASEDCVVIVVGGGPDIGTDVEHCRLIADPCGVARRFLSPQEAEWLAALHPDSQRDAFRTLWTCKEAVVKASGRGLGDGLRNFTVDCAHDEGPRVTGLAGMHLHTWRPTSDAQAALATPFAAVPVFMT